MSNKKETKSSERFVTFVCPMKSCSNVLGAPRESRAFCFGSLDNDTKRHPRRVMKEKK